jgi:hypothetical protein
VEFNLKRALKSILRWGETADKKEGGLPVSMVLLLREPRFPTLDRLRSAGEKAFGTTFTDDKESRHFVVEVVLFTIMKAGPHTLSFLNYTQPYGQGEFPQEFGRLLPNASQRQAWAEHTAWIAVDYVKGGRDLELEYAVLATICAAILDVNCLGLYVPREESFIPNDGSLVGELQRIAMSRPLGISSNVAPN